VGGAGRRLGGDKATRPFRGRPLWTYGFELLKSFCSQVELVGECAQLDLPTLIEAQPGGGPLGAIVHALKVSDCDWNFVLALDYPLLDADFVRDLGKPGGGLARLPVCQGQPHPLCGYYHRDAKASLPAHGSVLRALSQLGSQVSWVDFAADERFLNVNHPQDLL